MKQIQIKDEKNMKFNGNQLNNLCAQSWSDVGDHLDVEILC